MTASTQININHLTDTPITDIDIFLALLQVGQQITIQDQNDSANYQVWSITGSTTQVVGASNYWIVPVSLVSAGGNPQFANNHKIILATLGATGSSGSSGTSGVNGSSGSSGTSGTNGSSGTSGTSGSQPIRVLNQTLISSGWTYNTGSTYYEYTYSYSAITSASRVDFVPYNSSNFTAITSRVQPYNAVGSGTSTFYSQYQPSANMSGDIFIFTTT